MGTGTNGELTFLDALTIVGFLVGLQNLEMNLTQTDLQNHTEKLDTALRSEVAEIHRHLQEQDEKIDRIIRLSERRTE